MEGSIRISRSLKLANIASKKYLFVGLDDGKMITFNVDDKKVVRKMDDDTVNSKIRLSNKKTVNLGTQPINFSDIITPDGETLVFVMSDCCSVIYGSKGKLLFSNLDVKDGQFLVSTVLGDKNVFALLSREDKNEYSLGSLSLKIGTIATIEKLHVSRFKLDNEYARRITYIPSSKIFAVGTITGVWGGAAYPSSLSAVSSAMEGIFRPHDSRQNVSQFEPINDGFDMMSQSVDAHRLRIKKEVSYVKIFDSVTMDIIDTDKLNDNELVYSITSFNPDEIKNPIKVTTDASKNGDSAVNAHDSTYMMDIDGSENRTADKNVSATDGNLIVVGTTFVDNDDVEPRSGRILVYKVDLKANKKLVRISTLRTPGCVYCLDVIDGKILAGINGNLFLFDWVQQSSHELEKGTVMDVEFSQSGDIPSRNKKSKMFPRLEPLCKYHDPIVICSLAVRGNKIIIGDLMKSIYIVSLEKTISKRDLNSTDSSSSHTEINGKKHVKYNYHMKFLAHDFSTKWLTSGESCSNDTFIASDNFYNLMTFQTSKNPKTEYDARALDTTGWFNTGQMINRLKPGSIASSISESIESLITPKFIFGTVNGGIGSVVSMKVPLFSLIEAVQDVLIQIQAVANVLSNTSESSSSQSSVASGLSKSLSNYPHFTRLVSKFSIGCDYVKWKGFKNERMEVPPKNFIDGDLVELFLNFDKDDQDFIVQKLNDVLKRRGSTVKADLSTHLDIDKLDENTDISDDAKRQSAEDILKFAQGEKIITTTQLVGIISDLSRLH